MATHSMFLPRESQGRGSLVGCRLWGHIGSDTTEATLIRIVSFRGISDSKEAACLAGDLGLIPGSGVW